MSEKIRLTNNFGTPVVDNQNLKTAAPFAGLKETALRTSEIMRISHCHPNQTMRPLKLAKTDERRSNIVTAAWRTNSENERRKRYE